MGFFDEFANELASELTKGIKKAAIEGMRGKPLDDDEDIDSLSFGTEAAKEIIKSAKEDSSQPLKKNTKNNLCEGCGAKLHVNAKFCSKCGIKVTSAKDEDIDDYEEEDDDIDDDDEEEDDDIGDDEDENEEIDAAINKPTIVEKYTSISILGMQPDLYELIGSNKFISDLDRKEYKLHIEKDELEIHIFSNTNNEKIEIITILMLSAIKPDLPATFSFSIVEDYYRLTNNNKLIDCAKPIKPLIRKIQDYLLNTIQQDNERFIFNGKEVKYKVICRIEHLVTLVDNKLLKVVTQKEAETLKIYSETNNKFEDKKEISINISADVSEFIVLNSYLNHKSYPHIFSLQRNSSISIVFINLEQTNQNDLFKINISLPINYIETRDDELTDLAEPFKPIIERYISIMENL